MTLRSFLAIALVLCGTCSSSLAKTEVGGGRSRVSATELPEDLSSWSYRKTHRVAVNFVAAGVYGVAGAAL
ncbi:MAG: hypothetical protein K2X47_03495, partial [Bdellovibrionales bacterium]|nr:hypothetical protein [Bdellovibrionales bacterium]